MLQTSRHLLACPAQVCIPAILKAPASFVVGLLIWISNHKSYPKTVRKKPRENSVTTLKKQVQVSNRMVLLGN